MASVLVAPSFVAPARADHDRDHDSDHHHSGDRRHDRERHGCGCGLVTVSATPLSTTGSAASRERHRRRDLFSARQTPSLDIRLRMRTEGEDAHRIRFRVLAPSGDVYQDIRVLHRPDGRSTADVAAQLPVAGTFISTSSLFGRWRVVPYIDDEAEPCATGVVFTISE